MTYPHKSMRLVKELDRSPVLNVVAGNYRRFTFVQKPFKWKVFFEQLEAHILEPAQIDNVGDVSSKINLVGTYSDVMLDKQSPFGTFFSLTHDTPLTTKIDILSGAYIRRQKMKSKEDILNRLEDVEQVHRSHKRTYSIPRSDERRGLRPGQLAKLVFLAPDDAEEGARAERMWVEVKATAAGDYIGVLSNRPRYLKYIQQGEHVVFRPEHVCAIYVERNNDNWINPELFLVVSRKIIENEAWPQRAVRKEPHDDSFSGWLVMSSDQDSPDKIDADEYLPLSAHDLMNKFPILDSVLGEPIGTDWSWDEEACEYKIFDSGSKQ